MTTRRPGEKKTKLEKGNRGGKTPIKGLGETTKRRNRGRNREGRHGKIVATMRGRNRGRQRRMVTTTRGYGRK